ncbi:8-amino-7-oxononanoate synthase [Vibrio sp. S17_S38]|uniref:8-amino-7-oxononanoate synthase n=1 Tax=Vibrio sp. S17_S38 TaxID=2720229 RepID=UPI001680DFC4|nr:8-amino-7-oxononanoate synthase [Vibrio sp. S17_S38]MBD1571713.1 8-amino-7-oxononanoate synthase [Vibrio sp. S17_S38]
MFEQRIAQQLQGRQQAGLSRSLHAVNMGRNAQLMNDKQQSFVNFSSNDYLGLAQDPELRQAWQQGLAKYGCGSGASPLVTGFSSAHANLESKLCEWLGFERAVLFSSGFSANQAMLFTLLQSGDVLIQDKLNHASLIEAGLLSAAEMIRFKHNDVNQLNQQLQKAANDRKSRLVVTEGVFSMDGDQSDLAAIHQACLNHQSWLAVDDAHGIGVLGDAGAGSCAAMSIKPNILVVTFGKAFGLSGAAILCDRNSGDYLTQFSRHHVYSTAIPPSQAFALSHAIEMIQTQQWRRDKLQDLNGYYQEGLDNIAGYVATKTTIKPFICGSNDKVMHFSEQLKQYGFWVGAIRPPTVAKNSARLRITLTANHSAEQVMQLTTLLSEVVEISDQYTTSEAV